MRGGDLDLQVSCITVCVLDVVRDTFYSPLTGPPAVRRLERHGPKRHRVAKLVVAGLARVREQGIKHR